MAADLKEVIKELKERNLEQQFVLHGHCIGAHVATAVASDIAAGNVEGVEGSIPVIVDRGYGDGLKVAKKVTFAANLSFSKKHIQEHYNNKTLEKIEKHNGPMLFLSPDQGCDQMLHHKGENFTKEIMDHHNNKEDTYIELTGGDHWTPWPIDVHNQVRDFLKKQGIIRKNAKKIDLSVFGDAKKYLNRLKVLWVRKKVIPLFV